MTAPLALTGLEQAARTVHEHLDAGQRRVTLYGRASSGKTSAMRLIAGQLRAADWHVHRTQMTGDDDGAPVALATLAADLPGDVRARVIDVDVPWKQKLQAVTRALGSTGGRTGTGELVAVRAPPDDWLIVDGCGVGRTKYGPALLAHYGTSPRLISLSRATRTGFRFAASRWPIYPRTTLSKPASS